MPYLTQTIIKYHQYPGRIPNHSGFSDPTESRHPPGTPRPAEHPKGLSLQVVVDLISLHLQNKHAQTWQNKNVCDLVYVSMAYCHMLSTCRDRLSGL